VGCREYVEELGCQREDQVRRKMRARLLPKAIDLFPFESLHDEERGSVLGRVVVEHGHRSHVVDRVGGVAFTEKPRAELLVDRELRVQHLDGDALLIPMRGRKNDRHPAYPEHAVEPVLAAQHRSQAPLSAVLEVVVRHEDLRARG
jgi:hypothetical protein